MLTIGDSEYQDDEAEGSKKSSEIMGRFLKGEISKTEAVREIERYYKRKQKMYNNLLASPITTTDANSKSSFLFASGSSKRQPKHIRKSMDPPLDKSIIAEQLSAKKEVIIENFNNRMREHSQKKK